MKHIPVLLMAALTVAAACNKEIESAPVQEEAEYGTLEFTVDPAFTVETKTLSPYTAALTYETAVNNVQILVFGANGGINHYQSGTSLSGSFSTTTGNKTIWAIVNGPNLSTISSKNELESRLMVFSQNSKDSTKGFLMCGNGQCTVSATSTSSCSISVKRLLSRIALVSVKNNLPPAFGTVQFQCAFLSNVLNGLSVTGNTLETSAYLNKNGRQDEVSRNAGHIIGVESYTATCPELTYFASTIPIANGETLTPVQPYLFYALPNQSTNDPDGYHEPYVARKTVLVVAVKISGTVYYYPIVMKDGIGRNKLYSVALTISSLGSTDPEVLLEKGSATFSISVDNWESGSNYEENI